MTQLVCDLVVILDSETASIIFLLFVLNDLAICYSEVKLNSETASIILQVSY